MHRPVDCESVLDAVIGELCQAPIDLLNIGDQAGESAYLEHSRCSYLRTLRDIVAMADALGAPYAEIPILEIGAFLGVVSCALARLGFPVTALDLPEFVQNERLQERYRRYGVACLAANLRDYSLPADTGSFAIVIMCETLEHLNFNPLPVMAEVNRLLRKEGGLYLSLPNQASLVNRVKLLCGRSVHNPISDFAAQLSCDSNMIVGLHWREYTAAELEELVLRSGFSVDSLGFYTTHRASLPARLLYLLCPTLRGNLTLAATKVEEVAPDFHFHAATR
ncbi:class I SAM-dependent methyltransferase [Geomonas anaerohicana]|uniref:Class I SAM-dependent methyltransferase n=1 Tax=Geomonas anaerohicana TaxID=2798583 RepID=A0ABS0YGR7_9BACT|nr:class I SAM-dependent methyltransferase [Geomonas anaerohicana]MBJ6751458.1 class I SAM-dependent methyltransferase [Geomonas anaerohicana]